MATKVLREHHSQLTSDLLLQVNGFEFRAGGNPLIVQFFGPLDLGGLEGSMDKQNWAVLDDDQGGSISSVSNDIRYVPITPTWVRHSVAIDAGQPRLFNAVIGIIKESE